MPTNATHQAQRIARLIPKRRKRTLQETHAFAHQQQTDIITLLSRFHNRRRKRAIVGWTASETELHQCSGVTIELLKDGRSQRARQPHFVMRQQRFFERPSAKPCGRALIANLKAPAADKAQNPCVISCSDCAGANGEDKAVAPTKCTLNSGWSIIGDGKMRMAHSACDSFSDRIRGDTRQSHENLRRLQLVRRNGCHQSCPLNALPHISNGPIEVCRDIRRTADRFSNDPLPPVRNGDTAAAAATINAHQQDILGISHKRCL